MPETLGDRLRAAREAKGLAIEQLASITKLNIEFVKALENGRWDLLPGQVYLKPFTKICAEALDLDIKELYTLIDGVRDEKTKTEPAKIAPVPEKKRIDYKLPLVATVVLIVIAIISLTVKSRRIMPGNIGKVAVVPAKGIPDKSEIKWQRPWERPPADMDFFNSQRLRVETTGPVWACIVANQDTVFIGIMQAGAAQTFTSNDGFRVTLNRNDQARVYLNGIAVPAVGTGPERLRNLFIGPSKTDDSTSHED